MKRTVLIFGLISGLIVTAMMIYVVILCYNNPDFEGNMVIGYLTMIIAFAFIFVGIKNYRDKQLGGYISFGKAFKVGFLIALVASTMYVVTWLISYYCFVPDFLDKYTLHVLKEARADGATQAEIAEKTAEMAKYAKMYETPVGVVLLTYAEILPVGLLVTLISALILKRKPTGLTTAEAG